MAAGRGRRSELKGRSGLACVPGAGIARAARFRGRLAVVALAWLVYGAAVADPARAGSSHSGHGYRFGVFPYLPALTIDRVFGPMASSFAAALERPVYLKTKPTFEQFLVEIRRESYDIIFVDPFLYVDAAHQHGYLPLARLEGRLSAVVLTGSHRPWKGWADLGGKTLAAPARLSAVSELVRAALLDAGLVPGIDTTLHHYRTKISCLQAVLVGAADACALPKFVLPQIGKVGDGKLRVVAESGSTKHLLLAVHPRIPDDQRAKLRSLIVSWPLTEEGKAIMAIGSWPRFIPAQDAD
jgi:phosphonate transport system substrate-binding protein